MERTPIQKLLLLRVVLILSLFLSVVSLYALVWPVYESGVLFASRRWMAVLCLGIFGILLELFLLVATWTPW